MGGSASSELKSQSHSLSQSHAPLENNRYPFSMKFIVSLERLINSKRNMILRECQLSDCRPNHIFYLNAILDLQEILNRFENYQRSQPLSSRRTLKPQTIYDYLFTLNKIKLDLENFPKQFNSNRLYQQLYSFCSPINLNSFIDLYDISEIKIYVTKESNQQIKEYSFNAYFTVPHIDPPLSVLNSNRRNRPDVRSISSQSTTYE